MPSGLYPLKPDQRTLEHIHFLCGLCAVCVRRCLQMVLIGLLHLSCGGDAPPARTPAVVWRKLGSWSGRGSMQTDPFISDTGSLRLRWETTNEAAPGTGSFRVTVHSDVSGRPLILAVDARGVGRDTAYVIEDPRSFFLAVESANVDWTVAADEGVAATAGPGNGSPAVK